LQAISVSKYKHLINIDFFLILFIFFYFYLKWAPCGYEAGLGPQNCRVTFWKYYKPTLSNITHKFKISCIFLLFIWIWIEKFL
jgi:hypothetical protein